MADLRTLAATLLTTGPHKLEPTPRRIRILFGGTYIADTIHSRFVWEHPYFPQYYLPKSDLPELKKVGQEIKAEGQGKTEGSGRAWQAEVSAEGKSSDRVLVFEGGALDGLVRVEFKAMDAWFEEDQPIYVHPKDPYKRIDILPSTRHIVVKLSGHVVAESRSSLFLFETGLPVRYYLPPTAIKDWRLLSPTKTITSCPYKGDANYYSVKLPTGEEHKDIFWWYKNPISESIAIQGHLAPYNEKAEIWVDGVKEERPQTKFS
jgi:uncharacterized protein (DUF427 family)